MDHNVELAAALFEGVLSLVDSYHMSVAMDDLDKSVLLVSHLLFSVDRIAFLSIMR